jgi:hypothetical protein
MRVLRLAAANTVTALSLPSHLAYALHDLVGLRRAELLLDPLSQRRLPACTGSGNEGQSLRISKVLFSPFASRDVCFNRVHGVRIMLANDSFHYHIITDL